MSEISYWRETKRRYRLEASQCTRCGKIFFPSRHVCDACRSREFVPTTLPEEGQVVAHTIVRTPPSRFTHAAPYCVAIIQLTNGVRLTAQVTDLDGVTVETGMAVTLELRRIQQDDPASVICYGYKAVPR